MLVPEISLDAADDRAIPRPVRQRGGHAQPSDRQRTRSALAAHRGGPGPGRRRRSQRRVRPVPQSWHRSSSTRNTRARSSRKRRRATTPATWRSCGRSSRTSRSFLARPRRRSKAGRTLSAGSTRCCNCRTASRIGRCRKCILVDLRHERRSGGKFSAIGPTLERGMRDALGAGGQVMLLLNRRGFSTHVHCPACGYVAACQNCDLSLTFHRQRSSLMCHYCGARTAAVSQRARAASSRRSCIRGLARRNCKPRLRRMFPDKVVQRMDSRHDVAARFASARARCVPRGRRSTS